MQIFRFIITILPTIHFKLLPNLSPKLFVCAGVRFNWQYSSKSTWYHAELNTIKWSAYKMTVSRGGTIWVMPCNATPQFIIISQYIKKPTSYLPITNPLSNPWLHSVRLRFLPLPPLCPNIYKPTSYALKHLGKGGLCALQNTSKFQ